MFTPRILPYKKFHINTVPSEQQIKEFGWEWNVWSNIYFLIDSIIGENNFNKIRVPLPQQFFLCMLNIVGLPKSPLRAEQEPQPLQSLPNQQNAPANSFSIRICFAWNLFARFAWAVWLQSRQHAALPDFRKMSKLLNLIATSTEYQKGPSLFSINRLFTLIW